MRYLLTCFLLAVLIASCTSNDNKAAAATPANAVMDSTTIQWLDSSKDFGKIEEGQKLEVSFRFKNTGDKPLIIDRVQPSCGCTVADQSKEPVAPGAEGLVKATFNSEGHPGINHKTLFVYANTKGARNEALQFVVEVEKKK
jgi:hypothetical protein